MNITFETCVPDPAEWNHIIQVLPAAHLLQTWEWANMKGTGGWRPTGCIWRVGTEVCAAAMVLKRDLHFAGISTRINILYAPKGPLLDWTDQALSHRVLDDLQALACQNRAVFLKIDPDVAIGTGITGEEEDQPDQTGLALREDLQRRGWVFSQDQIQFRNSAIIDLRPSEEEILARMKSKARYNIRLAEKKGVRIRQGGKDDLSGLYRMYAETAVRDGFVIREEAYYLALWKKFLEANMAIILIAEVEDRPVAGLILFSFARRSWYLYGMSRGEHREKMPNYLLQWEAIRQAKRYGSLDYDLWGAPDEFAEQDPLWGVFRFKEGLGARVVRWIGAWDYLVSPASYRLYTRVIPRILEIMRRRGRVRTRQEVKTL
ncbi:MAG TPA: peptidoglycan bridge formation glycyltransferase FemA/FemB family protein [Anaerolineaceae bacterium]|nr:peptidoglycan bridge formation glycyltransferase FemA/FemB family protein [Anaerolineaceae bacterium]